MGKHGLDTKMLDALIKAFDESDKGVFAKVGVLGGITRKAELSYDVSKQQAASQTNAQIGARHELGDPASNLPIRSWLRMPITEKMQETLIKALPPAAQKRLWKEIIETKSLRPFVKKLAILGEQIVQMGFDTGGFGKWKPSQFRHKANQQTLVETQQLRNSVSSEVIG